MKVRDVMTTPVITVRPDTPFAEVVDVLLTNGISGVPVVDDTGALRGVVTEADLVAKDAYGQHRRRVLGVLGDVVHGRDPEWTRKAAGRTAADVMTDDAVTASPDDEVTVAARRMLEEGFKRLPVVDRGGALVGIVTRHDLLKPFHRPDDAILADVEALLCDPLRVPENQAHASVSSGVLTLEGTAWWPSDVRVLEAVVADVPGVVAVENRLTAREPEPGRPPEPEPLV
jgi:CBS domain-containing protein